MTQPTLDGLREIERSDNFKFEGRYWCVVRYTLITGKQSGWNLEIVILFHSRWGSYWTPTKHRIYLMIHASKAYYKKMRFDLMRKELEANKCH